MFKKSINRWAFDSRLSSTECILQAKKHGFDGIELNLEEAGGLSLDTSAAELKLIREASDKTGLPLSSLCSLLFWKYPITSSDPRIRDKGIKVIETMIDFSATLGIRTILVVPGMVHADPPLDFGNPPVPYREAWQRARTIIKELAGHAKTRGVVIGLENVFYNKFLITQVEYRKFLDEVAEECVKLYFDIGNTMLCGFPEDWIEDLAPYICQIHVKDFDKNVNTLHGWRNIFQGHVNWKNVTDALRKIRYQGYLVGEPALSPYLFQPEELVRVTSSALDRLREMVNAPA